MLTLLGDMLLNGLQRGTTGHNQSVHASLNHAVEKCLKCEVALVAHHHGEPLQVIKVPVISQGPSVFHCTEFFATRWQQEDK